METHKKFKMEQHALKIYIYACGFGLTAYTGFLCFGMRTPIAEWLSMTSAFVLLTGGAWIFRLCWLSYVFISYMYIIRCCIILNTIGFFGEWIDVAHWVAFGIGTIICTYFTININKYLHCNEHNEPTSGLKITEEDGRQD